ncbi:MAG TPA: head GIN domain-containing protein [Allosphingosinicella sp.]|nr:head GIN domain-containing protein [Allosphingosinicella sp.]
MAVLALWISFPASAAERRYTVTDFDRVRIEGAYQVSLATGRASSARASGSQEALDRLQIDVEGMTLRIRPNQSAWGGYPGRQDTGPLRITLTTQSLRAATVQGAGTLNVDRAGGLRLDIALAGSGAIAIPKIEADALAVALLGSGTIQLGGTTKTVRAQISGSGNLLAEGLTASDAQVLGDTAGTIRLTVSRSAKVTASASGDVDVLGSPACTVKVTGTGRVRCGPN